MTHWSNNPRMLLRAFLYFHADLAGRVNMGHGRHVPRQDKVGVKFHRSVKIRQEADSLEGGRYWPKAKLRVEPEWVD